LEDGKRMSTPDARSLDILDAIVRLNIETGKPVSSGLVERYLQRAVSSATIRSVMQGLEQAGLVEQPHSSAGRLPTDRGFRIFVDRLQSGWTLQRWDPPRDMRQLVDRDIRRSAGSQDRIKVLARLLSRLTDNISIILGPSWDTVRAVRVELYRRSSSKGLLAVIMENSLIRTGLVDLAEEFTDPVIAEATQRLTRRIQGRTISEIQNDTPISVDLVQTPATRCAQSLARQGRDLLADMEDGEVELEGVANILEEPEFREPEPLKALLKFIESPRTIRESLDRLDRESAGDFGVWIGRENPVGTLRRFSLLTGSFDLDGRRGVLAVLGPRRMSYHRALHGIDVLRRALATN